MTDTPNNLEKQCKEGEKRKEDLTENVKEIKHQADELSKNALSGIVIINSPTSLDAPASEEELLMVNIVLLQGKNLHQKIEKALGKILEKDKTHQGKTSTKREALRNVRDQMADSNLLFLDGKKIDNPELAKIIRGLLFRLPNIIKFSESPDTNIQDVSSFISELDKLRRIISSLLIGKSQSQAGDQDQNEPSPAS